MNFILDTDIVSYLLNKRSPYHQMVLTKLQAYSPQQIHISIFTKCELYFGLNRIDNRKKQYKSDLAKAIANFVEKVNILDVPSNFAEIYGAIRAELVNKGKDIGVMDSMIAAQAVACHFILVTHNVKHYQIIQTIEHIPKLKIADWVRK